MSKQKKAIVFISDIHYCKDGKKSQFKENDENCYYQKWENCIADMERDKNVKVKYLVVCGDLVETAIKREYDVIIKILNKFCEKFEVDTKNVLIIPGNHDVNRNALANYCDENDIDDDKAHFENEIKLGNYIKFFKEFKNIDLAADNAILDKIMIEEEGVLLLGLNSLFRESYLDEDHVGYIDMEKLKKEMQEYPSESKNIYVVTHHSVTTTRDQELPTLTNVDAFRETLELKGIHTFIFGHHHISQLKSEVRGDDEAHFKYIEIGSLGKIIDNTNGESYSNRFTVAVCGIKKFEIVEYDYLNGDWLENKNKKYNMSLLVPEKLETEDSEETDELPNAEPESNPEKNIIKQSAVNVYEKSGFLFEHLKKEGNYKEGHFHWKDGRKTLGWVNIASFLGNIDVLEKIKESIIDIFEQRMEKVKAVIGYGMEGNIIGSVLTDYWVEKGVDYYFYPSVHKGDGHTGAEKSLWNEFNAYTDVLLVCDIMFSGKYLKEILDSNLSLNKCPNVYVLSLFSNPGLLGQNEERIEEKVVRCFTLAEINIPVCEKDEEQCLIYSQQLKKIYHL